MRLFLFKPSHSSNNHLIWDNPENMHTFSSRTTSSPTNSPVSHYYKLRLSVHRSAAPAFCCYTSSGNSANDLTVDTGAGMRPVDPWWRGLGGGSGGLLILQWFSEAVGDSQRASASLHYKQRCVLLSAEGCQVWMVQGVQLQPAGSIMSDPKEMWGFQMRWRIFEMWHRFWNLINIQSHLLALKWTFLGC